MTEVTVRPYVPGDEEAINEASNRVFGTHRSLAEWEWKYAEQPEGRWIAVAIGPDGRLVAHCAAVPARAQVDGTILRAGLLTEVFTVPEAGGGLSGLELVGEVMSGFSAVHGGTDRLALLLVFAGERAARLGGPLMGAGVSWPRPVAYWVRGVRRRKEVFTGHEVREGFNRAAADDLWSCAAPRYPVALVRDGAWLQRRFTGRPGLEYVHLSAWRHGQVRASAVVRVQPPVALVADLVWDGEDPGALAALDQAVVSGVRAVDAEHAALWLMGDELAAGALRRLGWEKREQPGRLVLVARSLHPDVDAGTLPHRFYVTMGDADLV